MDNNYYREIIDNNLSMGEYSLLYYDNILEKKTFNKIIISTILKLHLKGFVELNRNDSNNLIIRIKTGKEKLKTSEIFIFDCLKSLDIDNDSIVTLDEFNISSTKVFARNARRIKKIILQEALDDSLINIEKYQKKRFYFFRALRILLLVLLSIIVIPSKIMESSTLILFFLLFLFINNLPSLTGSYTHDSKHSLNNESMVINNKRINFANVLIESCIGLFICKINYELLKDFPFHFNINIVIIYCIELIIALIFVLIEYFNFRKSDTLSDKAIQSKQNLIGLEDFLKDYSLIENKKALDIHLWEDYLAFSVLLGLNQNIIEELKINLESISDKPVRYYDYYENRYKYK